MKTVRCIARIASTTITCVLALALIVSADARAQGAGAPPTATVAGSDAPFIARIWRGRTPAAKADEYTQYLYENGIKKIEAIPGNRGVQMMRSIADGTAEYVVISYWDSIDAIKRFAGEDYGKTHNLPRDPEFLIEMEPAVKHLEVLINEWAK